MQTAVFAALLSTLTISSFAHDLEGSLPVQVNKHAPYHRVKDSLPLVDTVKRNRLAEQGHDIFTWYFDAQSNSLYSCVGDSEPVFCIEPQRTGQYSWSVGELQYA